MAATSFDPTDPKQSALMRDARIVPQNDYYTPDFATEYVVPYLKEAGFKTLWEPACGKGHMSRCLSNNGFEVVSSDIWMGPEYDLHDFEPVSEYDAIVTNPPFQNKTQTIKRFFDLGKPFALLVPITTFDSGPIRKMLKEHDGEWGFLAPPRTIHYIRADKAKSRSFFYSGWLTHKIPSIKNIVIM